MWGRRHNAWPSAVCGACSVLVEMLPARWLALALVALLVLSARCTYVRTSYVKVVVDLFVPVGTSRKYGKSEDGTGTTLDFTIRTSGAQI